MTNLHSKADQRELSKKLWAWGDTEQNAESIAQLQLAATPTAEGQEAWADIIYTTTEVIRSGLLDEDTVSDIFEVIRVAPMQEIDYPIDFYQATDRDKFWAYTIPDHGYLPQRYATAGSVKITTYRIGNSIDFWIYYIANARWDILKRGIDVYKNGFVKKVNSDGWSALMASAFYRNIVVNDNTALPNQLTPRLMSLMQVFMKRNGGGNMTSNGFRLTDMYISPEAAASMRSWDLSLVPEGVRENIFSKREGVPLANIFGVDINEHDDLGIGQPLQQLLTLPTTEGGFGLVLPPTTREVVLGMDKRNTGRFAKMPIRNPGFETFPDNSSYTHRSQTIGFYGWGNLGFGVLDNGWLLLGAF